MAKESGLAITTLTVATNDIRNDLNSFDVSTPRDVQETTGLDKSAKERLLLLADASVDLKIVAFNDAATRAHVTFKDCATTSTAKAFALNISGQTLSMSMLQTDYKISRGDDGAMEGTVPLVLADGTAPAWS